MSFPKDSNQVETDSAEQSFHEHNANSEAAIAEEERPTQHNSNGESDDPQLIELEAQLQQKEELVAALTERLEQAAEQLDRMRRLGVDRGGRATSSNSARFADGQQELLEDLKHAVEQWESMQAAASIGRVEIQLEEIRDLIVDQFEQIRSDGIHVSNERSEHHSTEYAESRDAHDGANDAEEESGEAWAKLKEEMLAREEHAVADHSAGHSGMDEDLPEVKDPPRIVEFGSATKDDLLIAVEERDDYISYLLKRLRASEQRRSVTVDWEHLQNVPDELRERLKVLEADLKDRHRLVEVELSLERARLARESSKLHQLEVQVERNMRLLGINIDEMDAKKLDAHSISQRVEAGTQGRRWLRFLGLKEGETE